MIAKFTERRESPKNGYGDREFKPDGTKN